MAQNSFDNNPDSRSSIRGWWPWMLALVLLLFAIGFGGFGSSRRTSAPAPSTATAPQSGAPGSDAATMSDTRVSFSGRMLESKGPHAFLFSSDAAGSSPMLVIKRANPEEPLNVSTDEKQNKVQITGKIRTLKRAELQKEFGADLDDETWKQHEGKPFFIADELTKIAPAGDSKDVR